MIVKAETDRLIFSIPVGEHITAEAWEWLDQTPERRYMRKSRSFIVPLSAANAQYLMDAVIPIPENILVLLENKIRDHEGEVKLKDISNKYKFTTKPFAHQRHAFNLCASAPYFALFMEMGTGKTKVAIDVVDHFMEQEKIDLHLVIQPSNVLADRVWQKQYALHSWLCNESDLGEQWEPTALIGSAKQRERLLLDENTGPVYLLNYEGLQVMENVLLPFLKRRAGCFALTLDESSWIKNPNAIRTKILLRMAEYAGYRLLLTGTPMTQNYLDLYPQFKFLHPDILGYSTFTAFRTRYAVMGGFEGKQVVGWQHIVELRKQVRKWSYTVCKDDCLDLPSKTYKVERLDMGPQQKKLYKEMAEQFIVEIEEELAAGGSRINKSTINTVLTKSLRLSQITSGFLVMDDETIQDFDSVKLKALLEIIQNIVGYGSKAVVQCVFRHEIQRIVNLLNKNGIGAVKLDGSVPLKQRAAMLDRFRNSPDTPVVVCQVRLASMGIDLTAANYMVRYTHTYSLQDTMQMEDRIHRQGQSKNVTYIDLVCRGTVDVGIQGTLRSKFDMASYIMKQGARGFARLADGTLTQ